jgi:plastocyanin
MEKNKIMKYFNNSKSKLIVGVVFFLSILTMAYSCTKSSMDSITGTNSGSKSSDGPGTNEVWIQDMAFKPPTIIINAGTTIKWTNKDAVTHDVTSTTGLFGSGPLNNGGTFSYTFSSSGTYAYYCTIHPSMTGSVTVN